MKNFAPFAALREIFRPNVQEVVWINAIQEKEGVIFDPNINQSVGPQLFIEAILHNRPATPNFYDGLKVQEVIDVAIEAHRKGCWVSLR